MNELISSADIARFLCYVNKGDCWLWTGGIAGKPDNTGQFYGKFWFSGKSVLAHRFSYEYLVGPIPSGYTIDHLCGIRLCVNPAHLEAVTMKENIGRGTGVAAVNKVKTHCIRGHEYTPENTMKQPRGRMCKTCRQAYWKFRDGRPQDIYVAR